MILLRFFSFAVTLISIVTIAQSPSAQTVRSTEDLTAAVERYKSACDGGDATGCNDLGFSYESGNGGLPKDTARAVALYRQACDGGSAFGCSNLGFAYGNGIGGLPKDPARAVALYKQACDGGNARGCNNLGVFYENGNGGLPKDSARAVALYKQACDGGYALGCNNLGFAYENGNGGLPKDSAQAVALYKQACDGGDAGACSSLGFAYENGNGGLPKDPVRAVALYRRACDGGYARGCNNLGVFYESGNGGLTKDPVRAVALFKQACDGGIAFGCNNLGVFYENGSGGLPKDPVRAVALFKQACDSGVALGCNNLNALQGREIRQEDLVVCTSDRNYCQLGIDGKPRNFRELLRGTVGHREYYTVNGEIAGCGGYSCSTTESFSQWVDDYVIVNDVTVIVPESKLGELGEVIKIEQSLESVIVTPTRTSNKALIYADVETKLVSFEQLKKLATTVTVKFADPATVPNPVVSELTMDELGLSLIVQQAPDPAVLQFWVNVSSRLILNKQYFSGKVSADRYSVEDRVGDDAWKVRIPFEKLGIKDDLRGRKVLASAAADRQVPGLLNPSALPSIGEKLKYLRSERKFPK